MECSAVLNNSHCVKNKIEFLNLEVPNSQRMYWSRQNASAKCHSKRLIGFKSGEHAGYSIQVHFGPLHIHFSHVL